MAEHVVIRFEVPGGTEKHFARGERVTLKKVNGVINIKTWLAAVDDDPIECFSVPVERVVSVTRFCD